MTLWASLKLFLPTTFFKVTFDDEQKFKPPSDKEWNDIFTADSGSFSN